jgi:hypothetical protein
MRRAVVLAPLFAAACGDNLAPAGGPATCEPAAATTRALSAVDRTIVGAAAPYPADLALAGRDDELQRSIAARRAAAWQVVTRALAPVPLAEPRLAERFGGQPTVPAWQTWYARDDLSRVFQRLYGGLGPDGRRARAPFSPESIAAAFAWNARAVDDLPSWPEERYLAYLAAIDDPREVGGVAGIQHVGYSPAASRALLSGYRRALACAQGGVPDPWIDEPTRPARPVSRRELVDGEPCAWTELGPYLAAEGSELVVTADDGELFVRRGARPDRGAFDCRAVARPDDGEPARCAVAGGGPIYVAVASLNGTATVDVAYTEADGRDPACTDGALPADAVLIKAEWRRAQFGATLPTYDTSGPRMAVRLRADGAAEWGPGDGQADPGPGDIYTVTTPNGATYRLAALHVMTRELDHWMWVTLWWSPEPDTDFGADRPAGLAARGPWSNYKMCAVSGYTEGDADPRGGQSGSLGDALAAVHRGTGAPTWCSNPYLEAGAGNAATNCIGCHQHGGTDLVPEAILADPARFPHHGTTRVRNNFATDYLWALTGGRGDDLAAFIEAEVDFWDATDP